MYFPFAASKDDAPVEDAAVAVDEPVELDLDKPLKEQVTYLKGLVNDYSAKADHFQRELGAALKENESLVAVQAENTELQDKVGAQAAQIAALEESLRVADTKIAKADEVIAAGRAIKEGLALLG